MKKFYGITTKAAKKKLSDDSAEVRRLMDQDLYRCEKSIQSAVMKYLKTQPGWWAKISDRFVAGIPDIVGCMYGHFFSIELKRPKGEKPTPLQFHNMELINNSEGTAVWIKSLQEAKDHVERWKKLYMGNNNQRKCKKG